MARLEAQEKGLYYPTQLDELESILRFIQPLRDMSGARGIDICYGKGLAMQRVAQRLGLRPFGIEIHPARAAEAAKLLGAQAVLSCSWEKSDCEITPQSFQLAFLNPPYDAIKDGEKSVRLEYIATRRATGLLQTGGILILVLPWYALVPSDPRGSTVLASYLAQHYEQFTLGRFADKNFHHWISEEGRRHDYGFAQIALIAVKGKPLDPKSQYDALLRLANPIAHSNGRAIAALKGAVLGGKVLTATEEGAWLPTLEQRWNECNGRAPYSVPAPETELVRFWTSKRDINQQAQLVGERGLWSTNPDLYSKCLKPQPGNGSYALLVEPSVNNKSTLISTGALDTLLIFDPARPAHLRPTIRPEEYLRWPDRPRDLLVNSAQVLAVASDKLFEAYTDCAVTIGQDIVFLSLFGPTARTKPLLATLALHKYVNFKGVEGAPYRKQVAARLERCTERYLTFRQALPDGWDHHIFIHPRACYSKLGLTSETLFYCLGNAARQNFGPMLSRVERTPFLPAWSEQIYEWGRKKGYVIELANIESSICTTTALRVNFPPGALSGFLNGELKARRMPVPRHYDLLGKGSTTKDFVTIDKNYDAVYDRTTVVQTERMVTQTCVLYFDGTLLNLGSEAQKHQEEDQADEKKSQ